jgi:hypothetical protein
MRCLASFVSLDLFVLVMVGVFPMTARVTSGFQMAARAEPKWRAR